MPNLNDIAKKPEVHISDSELLDQTWKKSCFWDAISDADNENTLGADFPQATALSTSTAATLVPALDQNVLLRMEQLQIPKSVPQEVARFQRLEKLK